MPTHHPFIDVTAFFLLHPSRQNVEKVSDETVAAFAPSPSRRLPYIISRTKYTPVYIHLCITFNLCKIRNLKSSGNGRCWPWLGLRFFRYLEYICIFFDKIISNTGTNSLVLYLFVYGNNFIQKKIDPQN